MTEEQAKKCRRCAGTGREPDHGAKGAEMKRKRLATGFSMRQLARKMGISNAYLCGLERGSKAWNDGLERRYVEALENMKNGD